ncbi:peptidase family C78-domain-containing protein [Cantharellus anzutake]|uniref:peptidase family C78-domain-containing protein n=1 Tax=Cantharellus anzutake TaxID=1750568 RepID=UPI0019060959|nr:peptidase family C78-domain-containing protein [Cantharellus anzutake]KAF8335448.1 peptidase family C78-domain-containing protein [Cantharellus anzutake]
MGATEQPKDDLTCHHCGVNLGPYQKGVTETHYRLHEESEASTSTHNRHPGPVSKARKTFSLRENVFWHSGLDDAPPNFVTPCLIPLLKRSLTRLVEQKKITRAVLCREEVCHYVSENIDRFWGCGYRNFMMACSALAVQEEQPTYMSLLHDANCRMEDRHVSAGESVSRPQEGLKGMGIRGLQAWIEYSWEEGYDQEGADDKHMKRELLGTKKWIGATDIHAAFTACGIPTYLVDFIRPNSLKSRQKSNNEGSPLSATNSLIKWITQYFDDTSTSGAGDRTSPVNAFGKLMSGGVLITKKMPIFLQHKGHSRTVVGYEKTISGETNLLIFDPSESVGAKLRAAALALWKSYKGNPNHVSPKPTATVPTKPSHAPIVIVPNSDNEPPDAASDDDVVQVLEDEVNTPTKIVKRRSPSVVQKFVNTYKYATKSKKLLSSPTRLPPLLDRRNAKKRSVRTPPSSSDSSEAEAVPSRVTVGNKRVRGGKGHDDDDDDDEIQEIDQLDEGHEMVLSVSDEATISKDTRPTTWEGPASPPPTHPGPQTRSMMSGVKDKISYFNSKGASAEEGSVDPMTLSDGLEPAKVLKDFRVSRKDLLKFDQYQILCFPLWAPLTAVQQEDMKELSSPQTGGRPSQDRNAYLRSLKWDSNTLQSGLYIQKLVYSVYRNQQLLITSKFSANPSTSFQKVRRMEDWLPRSVLSASYSRSCGVLAPHFGGYASRLADFRGGGFEIIPNDREGGAFGD